VKKRGRSKDLGDAETLAAGIAARLAPRAGSFIVTLYGDVVEPRGLPLWMGNIIEICGMAGISETLVRTAVSRLVASGRLIGDRQGRRSYYRLTDEARLEFAHAARILFEPSDAHGWRLIWSPGEAAPALEKAGFIRIGGHWMIGPSHEDAVDAGAVTFAACPLAGERLPELVAAEWNVAQWEAAYTEFLSLFEPLRIALEAGEVFADALCLQLRLFLVHAYRLAALRDPHLPKEALPEGWSGAKARVLFAALYERLSPGADRHAATLQSVDGPLPEETAIVRRRRATLYAARP
jgi:phenylacetic acid degradation operon negative regulatory protein